MRLRHKKNAEMNIYDYDMVIRYTEHNDNLIATRTARGYDKDEHSQVRTGELCEPHAIFKNDNPVHLELGMGKGRFISNLAHNNPNINYIGVEKSATIVLKAIDRLNSTINPAKLQNCQNSLPEPNLRFMCIDIIKLGEVFPPHSIDKIYLNFSDPWPKKRHESRRLMHINFLKIYEKLLKPGALIEFKTDNIDLFNFSLEEITKSNFKILSKTYDLHSDSALCKDNIMTEYEEKFSRLGNKICKLIAKTN